MTSLRIDRDDVRQNSHSPVEGLRLDYVEMYVEDLDDRVANWVEGYGFAVVGTAGSAEQGYRSVALRQGGILLVLTVGTSNEHPASAYVHSHGDGVARIAFRTADVAAAFEHAVANGACPLAEPARPNGRGAAVATVETSWTPTASPRDSSRSEPTPSPRRRCFPVGTPLVYWRSTISRYA